VLSLALNEFPLVQVKQTDPLEQVAHELGQSKHF